MNKAGPLGKSMLGAGGGELTTVPISPDLQQKFNTFLRDKLGNNVGVRKYSDCAGEDAELLSYIDQQRFPRKLTEDELKKIRCLYYGEEKDCCGPCAPRAYYHSPAVAWAAYNSSDKEVFYKVFPFLKPASGTGVREKPEKAEASKFRDFLAKDLIRVVKGIPKGHEELKKYIVKGAFPERLGKEELEKIRDAYYGEERRNMKYIKKDTSYCHSPDVVAAAYNSSDHTVFYEVFPFLKPSSGEGVLKEPADGPPPTKLARLLGINLLRGKIEKGVAPKGHDELKALIVGGRFPEELGLRELQLIKETYYGKWSYTVEDLEKNGCCHSPDVVAAAYNSSDRREFFEVFPFLEKGSDGEIRIKTATKG